VTARARDALEAAGYSGRVTLITADGEHGASNRAPYDAIIVTAGAWDIPPAWVTQLAEGGTLVVPLRMNSVTRSLAFRRRGDHLASMTAEVCGFVPMQGTSARPERAFHLPDPAGGQVTLRFDEAAPAEPDALAGALDGPQVALWSGVRIGAMASFADLHLWLAGFLPGFCRVAASGDTGLAALEAGQRWFPFGCTVGGSLACQVTRKLDQPGDPVFEFGAMARGPNAREAAAALIGQVRAWDQHGRDVPGDSFAFWPADAAILPLPGQTALFRKAHGTATISWPTPAQAPDGQDPELVTRTHEGGEQ
jgi:protein-L-isoaspartate(D-aspartate) O-methyltransferase